MLRLRDYLLASEFVRTKLIRKKKGWVPPPGYVPQADPYLSSIGKRGVGMPAPGQQPDQDVNKVMGITKN